MKRTRRQLLIVAAGVAGIGFLGGCLDREPDSASQPSGTLSVQSSFFVFDDIAATIAADAADAELLVPTGQHGHGWEPGPRVREEIQDADLFVHGMEGFQPWVDDIKRDLEADGADVTTVDVSTGVSLIEAGDGHDHEGKDEDTHETAHQDVENADPHFWMDPLRVKKASENIREGLTAVDPDGEETHASNVESFHEELDTLHERVESTVANGSNDVILVAGHDSFGYFADRYDVTIEALTNTSPDDRPTPRDIERAQEIVETHDLRHACADPLESQRAAEQLVAETDLESVLPLTAMPGVTEEWADEGWGYLGVMESVNLPTIEQALNAS
jgi:zinc transport system substrate-binding protein